MALTPITTVLSAHHHQPIMAFAMNLSSTSNVTSCVLPFTHYVTQIVQWSSIVQLSLHLECFLRLSPPLLPSSIFYFFICYNFIKDFLVFWWWTTAGEYIPLYLLWAFAFSLCLTSRRSDQISSCSFWWPLLPSFFSITALYRWWFFCLLFPLLVFPWRPDYLLCLHSVFVFRTEWKRKLFMSILHYAAKLNCFFFFFHSLWRNVCGLFMPIILIKEKLNLTVNCFPYTVLTCLIHWIPVASRSPHVQVIFCMYYTMVAVVIAGVLHMNNQNFHLKFTVLPLKIYLFFSLKEQFF